MLGAVSSRSDPRWDPPAHSPGPGSCSSAGTGACAVRSFRAARRRWPLGERVSSGPSPFFTSAATAGATAALADVAATGRTHLGAAGEAERAVDRGAGDGLQQLRGRVHRLRGLLGGGLGLRRLGDRGGCRGVLDLDAALVDNLLDGGLVAARLELAL